MSLHAVLIGISLSILAVGCGDGTFSAPLVQAATADPEVDACCARQYPEWAQGAQRTYFVGECTQSGQAARVRGQQAYAAWSLARCEGATDSTLVNGGPAAGASVETPSQAQALAALEPVAPRAGSVSMDDPTNCSAQGSAALDFLKSTMPTTLTPACFRSSATA